MSVTLSEVKLISTSKAIVDVEYTINNTAKVDLVLQSANGFLTKNRLNFAQVTLTEPVFKLNCSILCHYFQWG